MVKVGAVPGVSGCLRTLYFSALFATSTKIDPLAEKRPNVRLQVVRTTRTRM